MHKRNRIAAGTLAAVAAAALALSACSSSTSGSGAGSPPPDTSSANTNGASTSAPAPSTVTVTAPRSATGSASGATSSTSSPSSTAPGSSSASVSVRPVPAAPLSTSTATAPAGGTKYVISIWAQDRVGNCAANAYGGPVIAYLKAYGCIGVRRLLATTTVNGKRVGIAQSDISFRGATVEKSYQAAGGFRTLVTRDGTGNIDDLFRAGYRLPAGPTAVPSPDAFSALSQDNGVTVVDAWYLDGPTPDNDPALVKMAQDIYLQF